MKMKNDQFFLFFQVMEHRWNEIDRGNPKYLGEKRVPVPLCPPQIPHGLTRDTQYYYIYTFACYTVFTSTNILQTNLKSGYAPPQSS
jgi:hypothetical protein